MFCTDEQRATQSSSEHHFLKLRDLRVNTIANLLLAFHILRQLLKSALPWKRYIYFLGSLAKHHRISRPLKGVPVRLLMSSQASHALLDFLKAIDGAVFWLPLSDTKMTTIEPILPFLQH